MTTANNNGASTTRAPRAAKANAAKAGKVHQAISRKDNHSADGNGIIKEALAATGKVENAQAKLLVFLFEGFATYNSVTLFGILNRKGKDRTEAIDGLLENISSDYSILKNRSETKDKGLTKEQGSIREMEASRVRNVRLMTERVIRALYFLRSIDASTCEVNKSGTIFYASKDHRDVASMRGLVAAGDKAFREKGGKAKQKRAPRNAGEQGPVMRTAAENLVQYLTVKANALTEAEKKGGPIDLAKIGISKEEKEAYENLAITILAMDRADDGKITVKELNEFLKEKNAPFKVVNE